MKKKLSARQDRMLQFIQDFLEDNRYPPTVRDIQAGCEVSSTSVVDYNLRILQREGYLRREADVSRGIELLGERATGGLRSRYPLRTPGGQTSWRSSTYPRS